MRPFYAVRVVLTHANGTTTRDYVRGPMRVSKSAFRAFAIGDLLLMTREGWTCEQSNVSWDLYEISEEEVA